MPSLSFATQTALLQAMFQGVPLPQVPNLYVALHNANPGGPGTQTTNETSYANYARVAVPCSPGSWNVSQNDPAQVQNTARVVFPACGPDSGDALSFWSIGYEPVGPGQIVTSGVITGGSAYGFSGTAGSPCQLTAPLFPPGILRDSLVVLYQFGPGMLLPLGLIEGNSYYIGTINGTSLTLSLTLGNTTPVPAALAGSGILVPSQPLLVVPGVAPTFPVSSLVTYMD